MLRRSPSAPRIVSSCMIALAVALAASPTLAQEDPNKVRRLDTGQLFQQHLRLEESPSMRELVLKPKLCFWHDTSGGTSFGQSGFCSAGDAALGSACSCPTSESRPRRRLAGTVIEAPDSDGSEQVVR